MVQIIRKVGTFNTHDLKQVSVSDNYNRVWHKKAFFRSSQKIHDVVFFNEKLTYCKTNETVFNQYFQKLGIPQGGNQMSPKL